jgi:hypothetical protein
LAGHPVQNEAASAARHVIEVALAISTAALLFLRANTGTTNGPSRRQFLDQYQKPHQQRQTRQNDGDGRPIPEVVGRFLAKIRGSP